MVKVQSGSMTEPPLGTEAKQFIVVVGLREWEGRRGTSLVLEIVVKGVQSGAMLEAPSGMERFIVVVGLVGLRKLHSGGGGKAIWNGWQFGRVGGKAVWDAWRGVLDGDKCMHCDKAVTVGKTAIIIGTS